MIVVPPVVRLEDLVTGPNGGWAWQEPLEAGLALSVSEPPLRRIVPVGVAMFSAWADFHRRRGQAPSVDASLRSPYAYKVGLLSCMVGRQPPGRRQNLIGPSASQVESDLFAAAWEDEGDEGNGPPLPGGSLSERLPARANSRGRRTHRSQL